MNKYFTKLIICYKCYIRAQFTDKPVSLLLKLFFVGFFLQIFDLLGSVFVLVACEYRRLSRSSPLGTFLAGKREERRLYSQAIFLVQGLKLVVDCFTVFSPSLSTTSLLRAISYLNCIRVTYIIIGNKTVLLLTV